MANFNANEFNRKIREAQRRAEQQLKREVDRVNRANKKAVDDYNRKAEAHNRRVVADYNRRANEHNRKAQTHNRKVIEDLNRQLRSANGSVRYTAPERTWLTACTRRLAGWTPASTECSSVTRASMGPRSHSRCETTSRNLGSPYGSTKSRSCPDAASLCRWTPDCGWPGPASQC